MSGPIYLFRKFCCTLINALVFKFKGVKFGSGYDHVNGRVRIYGTGAVYISQNVRINSGMCYNPIGGDASMIFSTQGNGIIRIGEGCGLSNCTLFSRESITLGKAVLIGGGVKIYDTDFHAMTAQFRIDTAQDRVNTRSSSVVIEDRAFIGAHSIILKGVTIGEEAIVGAGSVVSRDVPTHEVWAGNPAKFVRKVTR